MIVKKHKACVIQNYWRFWSNYRKISKAVSDFDQLTFEDATRLMSKKYIINGCNLMLTSLYKYLKLTYPCKKNNIFNNKFTSQDARLFLSSFLIKYYSDETLGSEDKTTMADRQSQNNQNNQNNNTNYIETPSRSNQSNQSNISNTKSNNSSKKSVNQILLSQTILLINLFKMLKNNHKNKNVLTSFFYGYFKYRTAFNNWKDKDIRKLIEELSYGYWELEVIIKNEMEKEYTDEEQREQREQRELIIEEIERQQIQILENIKMIDPINGLDFFNAYVPLFIERSVLQGVRETMMSAFWDIFQSELEIDPPNYTKLVTLLEELKILLFCCVPNRMDIHQEIDEHVDMALIVQMIENKAFDSKSIKEICLYIISQLKRFQAEYLDESLEDFRSNIIGYIDSKIPHSILFTYFFQEMFERLEIVLQDTKEAKEDPLYQAYTKRLQELRARDN